jgi:hypothetical protein
VTKAAPWLRRHIEQWQWTQKRVGRSTSNRTAPQRQEPGTDDGSGVSLEDFTLALLLSGPSLTFTFRKAAPPNGFPQPLAAGRRRNDYHPKCSDGQSFRIRAR